MINLHFRTVCGHGQQTLQYSLWPWSVDTLVQFVALVREHFCSLRPWSGYTSVQFMAMVSLHFGTVCGHGHSMLWYSLWRWSRNISVVCGHDQATLCDHDQATLQYSLWP